MSDKAKQWKTQQITTGGILLLIVGLSGYLVSALHHRSIQHELDVLNKSVLALSYDEKGRFQYALVDEIQMVERLKQRGAAHEAAECLGRLHLSANHLSRGSATLLLLELEEDAVYAIPILKEIVADDASGESIRKDAKLAIEMIQELLERKKKTTSQFVAPIHFGDREFLTPARTRTSTRPTSFAASPPAGASREP